MKTTIKILIAGIAFTIPSFIEIDITITPRQDRIHCRGAAYSAPLYAAQHKHNDSPALMNFVASREGLQLNTAFSQIENAATRKRLVALVETLV